MTLIYIIIVQDTIDIWRIKRRNMMRKRLTIAVDYDDTLALCTEYALYLEEKKTGEKFDYESVDKWGKTGRATDCIFRYFGNNEDNFYGTQPLYEGAQEFINALLDRGHEVMILTAVSPQFATMRAEKIMKEFPRIKADNIILTSRKDLVHTDILIDDAPHNLSDTPAKYPICFRRPWNRNLTGLISVFSYGEILNFVDSIAMIDAELERTNKVYCLVAPSASGKTAIAKELAKNPLYQIPRSTTTRARRAGEPENAYNFVSEEEFSKLYKDGHFLETTIYAGNRYGTTKDEIDSILNSGKNAVFPIDISGANALKMKYGNKCEMVFIKRPKDLIVQSLLDRLAVQITNNPSRKDEYIKDISNRILSLSDERKNEELCDRVILNNGNITDVIQSFF